MAGESFKTALAAIGKEGELKAMDPSMFRKVPTISSQEKAKREQAFKTRMQKTLGVDEFCGEGVPTDCTETQQKYDKGKF